VVMNSGDQHYGECRFAHPDSEWDGEVRQADIRKNPDLLERESERLKTIKKTAQHERSGAKFSLRRKPKWIAIYFAYQRRHLVAFVQQTLGIRDTLACCHGACMTVLLNSARG